MLAGRTGRVPKPVAAVAQAIAGLAVRRHPRGFLGAGNQRRPAREDLAALGEEFNLSGASATNESPNQSPRSSPHPRGSPHPVQLTPAASWQWPGLMASLGLGPLDRLPSICALRRFASLTPVHSGLPRQPLSTALPSARQLSMLGTASMPLAPSLLRL